MTAVTQGAHGTVVNNGDGTFTYTPAANDFGPVSFSYKAYDGALASANTITVVINVAAVKENRGAIALVDEPRMARDLRALSMDHDVGRMRLPR